MSGQWLGIENAELHRLASLVSVEHTLSKELVAAVAGSVLTEPGDRVWGECSRDVGEVALVHAVVESSSAVECGQQLGLDVTPEFSAAYARWLPRLSLRATIGAIEHAAAVGARAILPESADWPAGLDGLGPHRPRVLYARGSGRVDFDRSVAVVGARAATGYGTHIATELSAELSERGVLIVSGGAYGIDGAAHRAALASSGSTVAFLAGGIDRLYPSGHTELLGQIMRSGLIFAEMPCGTVPSKFRFLQRNRLIAAATQATVVVEAGIRSGSLNTAGHAAALGRDICAVPGPITSPSSAGCHRLMQEFGAHCVTSADDIAALAWGDTFIGSAELPADAPTELKRVCDALTRQHQSVDRIAAHSGLSVLEAATWLAEAELRGFAESTAGQWRQSTAS